MASRKTKRKTEQRSGGAAAFVVGGDRFEFDADAGALTRIPAAEPSAEELEIRYRADELQREAARQRAEAQRAAEAAAREREQAEVREKAAALLMSVLSKKQRREYAEHRHFTIRGSDGKRYQIRYGYQHNVFELDEDGNRVVEMCGHANESLPMEDHMATQKLSLERDAPGFRRVANKYDIRGGGRTMVRE